jgi:catechol 2,3-dioxygenase-like lactoylglutathione lyase family enzyme
MLAKQPRNIASRASPFGTGVPLLFRITSTWLRLPYSLAPVRWARASSKRAARWRPAPERGTRRQQGGKQAVAHGGLRLVDAAQFLYPERSAATGLSMQVGAFSISLAVRDIAASQAFYEKLGFAPIGGEAAQRWLIMRNAEGVTIGLFQGMFERNTLTFNPGWDASCANVDPFTDVRQLFAQAQAAGLSPTPAVEGSSGPGWFGLTDPDGNPVLVDQHR